MLTAMEAVRRRPKMYLAAERDDPRLPGQALRVAVHDALTETPVGPTLTVSIVIESNLVFCLEDDGPGLRVEPIALSRPPWATEALNELIAGQGAPRGANLAVVTALCSAVVADIWRDGAHWRQWADWQHPAPPLQPIGRTEHHGTRVRYHLDPGYFGPAAALPADTPVLLADLLDESRDHVALSVDDRRTSQPQPRSPRPGDAWSTSYSG